MCKFPLVDKIKCTYIDNKRYMFIVRGKSKYGIFGFDANLSICLKLVALKYDGIEANKKSYILYTDLSGNNVGKMQFYSYNSSNNQDCNLDDKFDDILVINNVFLLFNGNKCDIYTYDRFNEAYIRECCYIEHIGENIIYEKKGRKGIFMYDKNNPFIYDDLDNIEFKVKFDSFPIFVLTRHKKQGVLFGKRELIKLDNLIVEQIYNPYKYSDRILYIVLLINEKKVIKYVSRPDYRSDFELYSLDDEFSRVEFYNDFYLVDNNDEVTLYDYENNKIATFVNGTIVEQIKLDKEKEKMIVYKIEDKYYFYLNGIFEEALEENINIYITTFEINDDIYEINTINKKESASFCKVIESMTDDEAEEMFKKYLEDEYTLKNSFYSIKLIKKS